MENKIKKLESKIFVFNENDKGVQVEMINNEPWFVAKDICDILEIENATVSLRNLDGDEKLPYVVLRAGQNREVNLVNESGLYNLIFQSRKPQAKAFRKWVTSEVLPAIRKTGFYETPVNKFQIGKSKYANRINDIDTYEMLLKIRGYLQYGDQKYIANKLGVTEKTISAVLSGKHRSPCILSALYKVALNNAKNSYNPYNNVKAIIESFDNPFEF